MAATKLILSNAALHRIGARSITTFGETTTVEGRAINAIYNDARDEILAEAPWTFAQRRYGLVNLTAPAAIPSAWVVAKAYAVGNEVLVLGVRYTCLIAHTSVAWAADLAAGDWGLSLTWITAHNYTKNEYVVVNGLDYICLITHTSGVWVTDLASVYWGLAAAIIPMTDDNMTVVYAIPAPAIGPVIKINYTNLPYATYKMENLLINGVATAVILSDTLDLKIQYTYQNDDPSLYYPKFTNAFECLLAYKLCFEITEATKKAAALFEEYKDALDMACASDSQQGTPNQPDQSEWDMARLSGGSPFVVRPGTQTWSFPW